MVRVIPADGSGSVALAPVALTFNLSLTVMSANGKAPPVVTRRGSDNPPLTQPHVVGTVTADKPLVTVAWSNGRPVNLDLASVLVNETSKWEA